MKEFSQYENIKQIADYYEFDHQSTKAIEEFSEAIKAICKYQIKYKDVYGSLCFKTAERDNIIEEIADSAILIMQLVYLMGADEEFAKMMEYKIGRTLEQIK